MEIIKNVLCSLPVFLVAVLCAGFISCGDDDEEVIPPYYSADPQESSPSSTSLNQILWGKWEGKGTNSEGKTCSMTLTLKSDGTGNILVSTSGVIMLKNFNSYTYSGSTLTLNLDTGDELILDINSLSVTSMSVDFSDKRGRLEATYNLSKTEDYSGDSGNNSGGSINVDIEKAPTFIVRWNQGTDKYTSSTENYYKKLSSTGRYTLYRHSNGTGEIGIASSNNLSTWGGFRVSSFAYVYRDMGTNYSTYYFFN